MGGASSASAGALSVDSDGFTTAVVAKRGAGFRGLEQAWSAAVGSGAQRVRITVKEGEYKTRSYVGLELGGRELEIRGEGRVVLRSPKPEATEVLVISGNESKATLRDLCVMGNVSFSGKRCRWAVRDCDIDGWGHWGLMGFSGCEESQLSVTRCYLHDSGKRDAIIFRGHATSLRVAGCEFERCRSAVRCGDAEGSRVVLRENHVHDAERGLLVFKPACGRVEGNTLWACRWSVLLCSRNGRECDSIPGLATARNVVYPSRPPTLPPIPTGPRCCGGATLSEDAEDAADFDSIDDTDVPASPWKYSYEKRSSSAGSDPVSSQSSGLPSPVKGADELIVAVLPTGPGVLVVAAELDDIQPAPLLSEKGIPSDSSPRLAQLVSAA